MKRAFFIFLTILIVLSFSVIQKPSNVYAQGFGVTWESSFQVQNLGTADASILMYYYDQNGGLASMATDPDTGTPYPNPDSDTVAIGQSNTYYPIHAESGFNGSVVISSSEPIAVISNVMVNTTPKGNGSYVGFQQGAPIIYFPLVMKGNGFQTTTFNVQNTGSTDASIVISFIPEVGSTYSSVSNINDTLKVGAAHTYNLKTLTEFGSISKWVGSVTVSVVDTANDSIAGVANTVSEKFSFFQLATYNAFTGGSTTVKLPLIQENNNGNRTSINCQNIDPAVTTDVTVTFIPEPGNPEKAPETKTGISPNGLAVFLQDYQNDPLKPKFIGSALVTSSPAVPLVCVVNQQRPSWARSSAYEGLNPADITDKVVVPLIQSRNGGGGSTYTNNYVYTSINLASGDGDSHTITCDYSPAPGFADPPNTSGTGAVVVINQDNIYGTNQKFIGGATCTIDSSGAGLIAVVNQNRQVSPTQQRDSLSTYVGFNVNP